MDSLRFIVSIQGKFKNINPHPKDTNHNGIPEYGRLGELLDPSMDTIPPFKPRANDIFERNGYLFAVFLPQDPSEAELLYCAVGWPADPRNPKDWPCLSIDPSGIVYEAPWPLPRKPAVRPELSDIYIGKPYVSGVNLKLWKRMTRTFGLVR